VIGKYVSNYGNKYNYFYMCKKEKTSRLRSFFFIIINKYKFEQYQCNQYKMYFHQWANQGRGGDPPVCLDDAFQWDRGSGLTAIAYIVPKGKK
jgi:hypothetical protein